MQNERIMTTYCNTTQNDTKGPMVGTECEQLNTCCDTSAHYRCEWGKCLSEK